MTCSKMNDFTFLHYLRSEDVAWNSSLDQADLALLETSARPDLVIDLHGKFFRCNFYYN